MNELTRQPGAVSIPASRQSTPIASLHARLERLAADPRVRLLPDGPAIAAELGLVLAAIDENDRRLAALEAIVARLYIHTFGDLPP